MYLLSIIKLLLLIPVLSGLPEEYFLFSSRQEPSQKNISMNPDRTVSPKTIRVKEVAFPSPLPATAQIDSMFDAQHIEFHPIDLRNWPEFTYHPEVKFRIAYSAEEIYLQYRVKETCIKAVFGEDAGSAPYKDSCVEFFIIPGTDSTYYNLEMNCIGKGTFAGGAKRTERTRFGEDVLRRIRRTSTLGDRPVGIKKIEEEPADSAPAKAGVYQWQLTVALPVSLFSLSPVPALKGRTVRANFYKCGDDMPERHYLSWSPVGTPRPNFHSPEYFGYLIFE